MMKKTLLASLALALAFGGLTTATLITGEPQATAQVQSSKSIVDAAKKRRVIGETAGGYLDIVTEATAAERNAMNEINIGRKSVYTRLARERNEQIEVVAALTGEKQIAKAEPGEMIMGRDGVWVAKLAQP